MWSVDQIVSFPRIGMVWLCVIIMTYDRIIKLTFMKASKLLVVTTNQGGTGQSTKRPNSHKFLALPPTKECSQDSD